MRAATPDEEGEGENRDVGNAGGTGPSAVRTPEDILRREVEGERETAEASAEFSIAADETEDGSRASIVAPKGERRKPGAEHAGICGGLSSGTEKIPISSCSPVRSRLLSSVFSRRLPSRSSGSDGLARNALPSAPRSVGVLSSSRERLPRLRFRLPGCAGISQNRASVPDLSLA